MRRQPIDPVFTAEPELQVRLCEHPGCEASSDFRAPDRGSSSTDHWFCLGHMRAYNLAWNCSRGMSDSEIEAEDPARRGLAAAELEARRAARAQCPAHP